MAKAGAIRFGRAFVELFADNTLLVRGLRAAERKLRAFGASISRLGRQMVTLGAVMFAPLAAASKIFTAMGDSLDKMSKRTGISVESLSGLSFAAEQSGADIKAFEVGVRRMQRTIVDAERGLSTAIDAFAMLGLSFSHLKDLTPEEQFALIADRISNIKDPTRQAAAAMMIFGRSGTSLLPMMKEGAAGINKLVDEARAMGIIIRTEDATAAAVLNDAMNALWRVVKMTAFWVGSALAGELKKLTDRLKNAIIKVNEWINQNRQIIVIVAKIAAALVAGGIALMAFGTSLSLLGIAFGKLAALITLIGTGLKALGAVIAFLAQPIVLVIGALAALGAYLLYVTGAGAKALGWLGERFKQLKNDASDAYQGIADALAAGDIALAARVLWLTMKMEWTRGVNFLEKIWLNFRNFFVRVAYDAFDGALAAAVYTWNALEVGWIELTSFLQKAWNNFSSFFARTWEKMKAIATKVALWIMRLFDRSIDLEAAYSIVDEEKGRALDKITQEQQSRRAEIEQRRQSRRAGVATMRDAMLEQIGKQNAERYKELDDAYAERMRQNANDLDEARRAWQQSLQEARQKRFAPAGGPEQLKAPGKLALPEIPLLGEQFDKQAARITAAGGFSGFLRFGAEGQSAAERTANGVEQIVKNTRDLLELERDNQEAIV